MDEDNAVMVGSKLGDSETVVEGEKTEGLRRVWTLSRGFYRAQITRHVPARTSVTLHCLMGEVKCKSLAVSWPCHGARALAVLGV